MATVLVTPVILRRREGEFRQLLLSAGLEVRDPAPAIGGRQLVEQDLVEELQGVDAVLAGPEPYTPAILEQFPRIRAISRSGVGFDAVDVEYCSRRRIAVGFTPGTNHGAVAEQTFALILAIAKGVVPNHLSVAKGEFIRRPTRPLRGRTLGVIGLGRIGRAVARLGQAFEMRVIGSDPVPDFSQIDASVVQVTSLEQLLAESDYITLHAPMSPETHRLIARDTISRMKRGVIIINTARGGLIDEPALAAALASGHVGAAGLDVFADEPPVGSPLLTAPNVVCSPHLAGVDEESVDQMATMSAQTIVDLYEGRWPAERLVNAAALGAGWRW